VARTQEAVSCSGSKPLPAIAASASSASRHRRRHWNDPIAANAYAQGLCRVLRLLSVPGSVSYELAEDIDVDAYLRRYDAGAAGTPLAS
jgi:hypothetical protein